MANNLGRNLQPGEVVVIQKIMMPYFPTMKERAFVCHAGLGMRKNNVGDDVYGYWHDTQIDGLISGRSIDPEETTLYNALVGTAGEAVNRDLLAESA